MIYYSIVTLRGVASRHVAIRDLAFVCFGLQNIVSKKLLWRIFNVDNFSH